MADNTTMPEGLSTPEIPISKHIEDLVDINMQTWDLLDDQVKKQSKTDSIQIDILTKIYEALSKDGITTKPEKPKPSDEKPPDPSEPKENQASFFEGLKAQFGKFTEKMSGVTSNLYDNIMPTVLGPLNMITQPLQDLTGVDALGGLKKGFSGIFGKKSPKKPSAEEVAKGGFLGAGFLYLSNMMEKWFGKKDGEENKLDKLKDLFKGGQIPSGLMKGLGIGAIVASIGWMIVDSIKGAKMSDIWGTSKVSGIIGGVLAGVDKGLKGSFKNMGKWALMGAGIGTLVAPGIGTLLGGLIGAAFGGIMSWIGAEKIAKFTDKIGGYFGTFWNKNEDNIKNTFSSTIDFGKQAWNFISSSVEWLFSPLINAWKAVFTSLNFKEIWESDSSLMTKLGESARNIIESWIEGIKTLLIGIGENIGDLWKNREEIMENVLGGTRGLLGDVKEGAGDFLGGLFNRNNSTQVQDAIITKTGEVIHTSQDDNIIATKNTPTNIVSMPDVNNNVNVTTGDSEITMLLKQLIDVVKNKPVEGGTTPTTSPGLDSLRFLGVS